jgi:hypothetical protein
MNNLLRTLLAVALPLTVGVLGILVGYGIVPSKGPLPAGGQAQLDGIKKKCRFWGVFGLIAAVVGFLVLHFKPSFLPWEDQ